MMAGAISPFGRMLSNLLVQTDAPQAARG